jgi:hypothetical protein
MRVSAITMSEPAIIAARGDLVLCIQQDEKTTRFSYRVDSTALKARSRYFERLFGDQFDEGKRLLAAFEALKTAGYSTPADAPNAALPTISIVNVGRISQVSSIRNLIADFLHALHGNELAVAKPPLANLANLAVVADRFDALPYFGDVVRKKKYLEALDSKTKGKEMREERARQRLLLGILIDYPLWVTKYSKHLIMRDSVRWKPEAEAEDNAALWWDLPNGVEGKCKEVVDPC